MALTRFQTTGPREAKHPETVIARVLRGLGIGEFLGDTPHIDIEQRTQYLALVGAQHRRSEPSGLVGE